MLKQDQVWYLKWTLQWAGLQKGQGRHSALALLPLASLEVPRRDQLRALTKRFSQLHVVAILWD